MKYLFAMSTSATVVALVRGLVELRSQAIKPWLMTRLNHARGSASVRSQRVTEVGPQRLGLKGPLLVRYRQRSIQKGYG